MAFFCRAWIALQIDYAQAIFGGKVGWDFRCRLDISCGSPLGSVLRDFIILNTAQYGVVRMV